MSWICLVLCMFVLVHADGKNLTEKSPPDVSEVNKAPVVVTPSGTILGSLMTSRRGRKIETYRGIRYAEPPIGQLRFQPPKLILHYSEVVNATTEGPACPQPAAEGSYVVDEDCLRLNVYTHTTKCSALVPVVVFIHAGGFYSASGRSDEAGPHYLLDHNMVLVTINYRLGSLGFLSTGDALAPGNNGLKDQVAALRWVRRNVAAFCGDPNLVTVSGYSAGSISIGLHMVSPMSKGLFHRARAMSGSPFTQVMTPPHQYHLAERQARVSGCPTHNSTAIVECLRRLPWKDLGNSLDSMFEFGYDPILVWTPVVEPDFGQERFLPTEPLEAVRQGHIHSVPLMISQTRDEFFWKAFNIQANSTLLSTMDTQWKRIAPISFQLPRETSSTVAASLTLRRAYLEDRPLRNDSKTAVGLGQLYGDSVIGFPVHRMAKLMCAKCSSPVYYYEFNYMGNHSFYESPSTGLPVGVAHHDDLIYLFSLRLLFPDIPVDDSLDSRMVDKMTAIMYHFAKHGDPNAASSEVPELMSTPWPPMRPEERQYIRMDTLLSIHRNLFEDRFATWEQLYPVQLL